MAARSTVAAGNLPDAINWDGGIAPDFTNSDTWSVEHAMTQAGALSVGADGLAATVQMTVDATGGKTGKLTINSGLWTQKCTAQTNDAEIIFNAGANGRWGGASGTIFKWRTRGLGALKNQCFAFNGVVGGTRITWDKASSAGAGFWMKETNSAAVGLGVTATATDFIDCGGAATGAVFDVTTLATSTKQKVYLDNCTFTRCAYPIGMAAAGGNIAGDTDVYINKTREYAPTIAVSSFSFSFNCAAATTGLRQFTNNGMPFSAINLGVRLDGWVITGNVYGRIVYSGITGGTPTTIAYNYQVSYPGRSATYWGSPGDLKQWTYSLLWDKNSSGSYNGASLTGLPGTHTIDGAIIENTGTASQSDGFIPDTPMASATTFRNKRTLVIPGATGISSSGLTTMHSSTNTIQSVEHATQHLVDVVPGSLNAMYGAGGYYGKAGSYEYLKDSLFAAPTVRTTGYPLTNYFLFSGGDGMDHIASSAGSTSASVVFLGKTFNTTAGQSMVSAGAKIVVVDQNSVAGAPTVGDSFLITGVTATTVTGAGFATGTVFVGVKYTIVVGNVIVSGACNNNVVYNGNAATNYDENGLNGFSSKMGTQNCCTGGVLDTNTLDLATGANWTSLGPKFKAPTRNSHIFPQQKMSIAQAAAWVTATAYVVGDLRSTAVGAYFGGATIDYYCIAAHTSGATSKPGDESGAPNWRTQWIPAIALYLSDAQVAGTLYSDPTLRVDGDGAVAVLNKTAIEYLFSWVRDGFMPLEPSLRTWSSTSDTPGAVQWMANLATKLAVTGQPTMVASGVTFGTNVAIAFEDVDSAIVTAETSSVIITLNILTGSVVLSGTTTRAAVAGVATFNDLSVVCSDGATFTLTAMSGTLTTATTSMITGTAAAGGGMSGFTKRRMRIAYANAA